MEDKAYSQLKHDALIVSLCEYLDAIGNGKPNILGLSDLNYTFDKTEWSYANATITIKAFIQDK